MGSRRVEKVSRRIVHILAELAERGLRDPRVAGVTFTAARVTPDLRHARVFFTVINGDPAECAEGLARASAYLRRELARELALKYSPDLAFEYDETLDRAARIEDLLRRPGGDDHGA
jgi:ribosome-binding factor A